MDASLFLTPDHRTGVEPPFTDGLLQTNLVLRTVLGILAILACIVPMRLLWKNGEFAASIFCVNVTVLNFFYVVNALLWSTNDVQSWWAGYGWCDLQVYLTYPLSSVYANSMFEILRVIANRVKISRATPFSAKERRREQLVSAAVIFTVPIVQVAINYLVMAQRYNVSTLVGCNAIYDSSWLYLVFMVLPTPIFTIMATGVAVIIFRRFLAYDKSQSSVFYCNSSSSELAARQQRIRRKIYFVTAIILVPYLPLELLFFANNIAPGLPWTKAYDFRAIHFGGPDHVPGSPLPRELITFTTSRTASFVVMNPNYISIITAVPFFFTFGTTPEAIKSYKRCCLWFPGIGRLFPQLHNNQDKPGTRGTSWGSSTDRKMTFGKKSTLNTHTDLLQSSSSEDSEYMTKEAIPFSSDPIPRSSHRPAHNQENDLDLITTLLKRQDNRADITATSSIANQWSGLSSQVHEEPPRPRIEPPTIRISSIMRTTIATPLRLPRIPPRALSSPLGSVHTRVWSRRDRKNASVGDDQKKSPCRADCKKTTNGSRDKMNENKEAGVRVETSIAFGAE